MIVMSSYSPDNDRRAADLVVLPKLVERVTFAAAGKGRAPGEHQSSPMPFRRS
jgi:hypothetical protein